MAGPTDDVFGGGDPLVRYKHSALAASGVVYDGKSKLMWATCYNNSASARYFMLFDSATVPANGTTPDDFALVTAGTQSFIDMRPDVAKYSNGISWAVSSTPATLTVAGSDALVRVYYRGY